MRRSNPEANYRRNRGRVSVTAVVIATARENGHLELLTWKNDQVLENNCGP